MLMGSRWSRSPFRLFSEIDNQARIMFIGFHEGSFPGTTLRLPFARQREARQPDQSGAGGVRILLLHEPGRPRRRSGGGDALVVVRLRGARGRGVGGAAVRAGPPCSPEWWNCMTPSLGETCA